MADAVNHDTGSAVLNAGKTTLFGAIIGVIAAAALTGGAAALGIFLLGGGFWPVTTAVAAIFGGVTYGTTGALIGGLIGLAKGSSRVTREKEAYQERVASMNHTRQHQMAAKVNDAEIKGMQQGYMAGVQDGQQQVVSQLQQAYAQEQQNQMQQISASGTPAAAGAVAVATAEANCACGPHSEAVIKQREQAATAAPKQLGA